MIEDIKSKAFKALLNGDSCGKIRQGGGREQREG